MNAPTELLSYADPFAPRDGPPAFPNLHQGLVGAWYPPLGPTGKKLYDVTGRNDGTLTNMEAGTDWVQSPLGWVLDFDGVNERVTLADIDILKQISMVSWIYPTAGQAVTRYPFAKKDSYLLIYGHSVAQYRGVFAVRIGSVWRKPAQRVIAQNAWSMFAGTYDGTSVRTYINGVGSASGAISGNLQQSNFSTSIADSGEGAAYFAGRVGPCLLYNRALTHAEIQHFYRDPFAPLRLEQRVFPSAAIVLPPGLLTSGHMSGVI